MNHCRTDVTPQLPGSFASGWFRPMRHTEKSSGRLSSTIKREIWWEGGYRFATKDITGQLGNVSTDCILDYSILLQRTWRCTTHIQDSLPDMRSEVNWASSCWLHSWLEFSRKSCSILWTAPIPWLRKANFHPTGNSSNGPADQRDSRSAPSAGRPCVITIRQLHLSSPAPSFRFCAIPILSGRCFPGDAAFNKLTVLNVPNSIIVSWSHWGSPFFQW